MPVPDGPQFKLYHATPTELGAGQIIEPRKGSWALPNREVAFATDDYEHAYSLAESRTRTNGLLFAPVYEVSHVDPEEAKAYRERDTFGSDVLSYHGYKPEKIAKWVVNPDI